MFINSEPFNHFNLFLIENISAQNYFKCFQYKRSMINRGLATQMAFLGMWITAALSCNTFETITTPITPPRRVHLDMNHNQDLGIGIWTKFYPSIAKLETPIKPIEQMLIFSQANPNLSEYYIIYSIKFDQILSTLYHEIYLHVGETFQVYSLPIDAFSSLQRWVFLFLSQNHLDKKYSIFLYYSTEREYTLMANGNNGVWAPHSSFVYQIGQTLAIKNQFVPQVEHKFTIFRGQISDIYFSNIFGTYFDNIPSFVSFIEGLVCTIPNPCPEVRFFEILNRVTSFNGYEFISKSVKVLEKRYLISGWAKVKSLDTESEYTSVLMRTTINQNYFDNQKQGDRLFYFQYYQHIQPELNGFYFSTYSSNADQTQDAYKSTAEDEWMEKDAFYERALTSWHYFTFQYGLSDPVNNAKLEIFFAYQQTTKLKFFQKREQVPDQTFYFYVGGDKYSQANLFRGEIANLQFFFCFATDQHPTRPCHYSCSQCVGPTMQECDLCVDPQVSNRELISSIGECVCKPNFIDRKGDYKCQSASEAFDFVQIQEIESNTCQFGEFSVGGEFCMKCPVPLQQEGFYCADCWMNPRGWYLMPICTFDYLIDSVGSLGNYQIKVRTKKDELSYYLDKTNQKLLICEGCQYDAVAQSMFSCKNCYKLDHGLCKLYVNFCEVCNDTTESCTLCEAGYAWGHGVCIPCPPHCISCYYDAEIQKPICQNCENQYGLDEGQCRQCGQYCALCERQIIETVSFMKCFLCEDTRKYYLSYDGENCHENLFPNCLIAAESKARIDEVIETSINFRFKPTPKINEVKLVCLRCAPGFIYFIRDNECLPSTNYDETITSYSVRTYNLGRNSNPSLNQACPNKCNKCIERYVLDKTFCISCDYGYYSQKYSGICSACPIHLNCRTCSHQNIKYKDDWKWDIRAHYYYSIGRGSGYPSYMTFVEPNNVQDNQVLCTSCKLDYILYQGICVKGCHSSCKTCVIVDYQSKCVECKAVLQGQLQSVEDGKCISCSYNCGVCRSQTQEEVKKVNYFFDFEKSEFKSFSTQCLKPFNQPHLYYNSDLAQFVQCSNIQKPCIKQAKVVFQTYCSDSMYETSRLAASDAEIFRKHNLKLSTAFNSQQSSSFPQIENHEFYSIMNQIQLNHIEIILNLVYDEQGKCHFSPHGKIQSSIRNQIFTLQIFELTIIGNGNLELHLNTNISFVNIDKIKLYNILFIHNDNAAVTFTSLQNQNIRFENLNFKSQFGLQKMLAFQFINTKHFEIQNLELTNLNLINTIGIFSFSWNLNQKDEFVGKITNFKIQSSTLDSTNVFLISNTDQSIPRSIEFTKLNIQFSKFTKSSLITTSLKSSHYSLNFFFFIYGLVLQSSEIKDAIFIENLGGKSTIGELKMDQVKLFNSVFIQVEIFQLSQISFTYNYIDQGCLIFSLSGDSLSQTFKEQNMLSDITFSFNQYTHGKSFLNYQQRNQNLMISKLTIKSNQLSLTTQSNQQAILTKMSLFFIEVREITFKDTSIIRGQGYPELAVSYALAANFEKFYISLDKAVEIETIHASLNCLSSILNENYYTTFLFLYAVKRIYIDMLQVLSLTSINSPLIQIKSSDQFSEVQEEIIIVKNSVFSRNSLISNELGVQQSIMAIDSQQFQKIYFQSNKFQMNHLNSYLQDITSKSASTLLVSSPNSQVFISDLHFANCLITNNKGSNMIIRARELKISSSSFLALNNLIYSNLMPSIFWGSGVENFYEENLSQLLGIKAEGGAGYFNVEKLEIQDLNVQKTNAQHGGAFYIDARGAASIKIVDSFFSETQASLNEWAESQGGAIHINSKGARLNLTIKDCEFSNSYSRQFGGGIYIVPSQIFNQMDISSILVRNSYSFFGSFLYILPQPSHNQNSLFLKIQQLKIENNQIGAFLEKLIGLTNLEIESFTHSYLLDISGGHIGLSDIQITSLQLGGLIRCNNFNKLIIREVSLQNLSVLAQPLIMIEPLKYFEGEILLSKIKFQSIGLYENPHRYVKPPPIIPQQPFYCRKIFQKPVSLESFYNEDLRDLIRSYNLKQLLENRKVLPAIIIIKDLTSTWLVQLIHIQIRDFKCPICQDGLVSITGLDLHKSKNNLRIIDSVFRNNQCGQNGCLNVRKSEGLPQARLLSQLNQIYKEELTVEIKNSQFTGNLATLGGGIYISGINILIIQCLFINNQAARAGGAIYFIRFEQNEIMLLVETELSNNFALIGGALYISDYNLNNADLLNIVLYGNQAEDFGSNLVQPPYKLTVTLNKGADLLNTVKISTDVQARIDLVDTPKDQKILFPSGQSLDRYKYFDNFTYVDANLSLRLIPLNSQGQRMKQLKGTYCKLDSRIIDLEDPQGKQAGPFSDTYATPKFIKFNESSQDYNLDNLTVKFSPSLRNNSALQLRFQCDSIKVPIFDTNPPYLLQTYATNYSLLMNVQSFYCQQGEFLTVENEVFLCQLCDANQDQYSVQPGTVCKLKDQNTMLNVTGARVNLRKGFWRPDENNIYIENCRNLEENCLGGWDAGDSSCFLGHIGALCEQCDLYNLRGDGPYSVSTSYKCGSCNDVGGNVIKLIFISLWTFISIIMSVNSTLDANLLAALGNKFKKVGIQVNPRSGISGILIKVFTNYMQIISTIATFQLKLPSALTASVTSVGSPMESMSYSLDCLIIELAKELGVEIIYFRIIWGLIMPVLYILVYFLFQAVLIIFKISKPNLGIISTTLVYMYIYLQPTIVGSLASLISFREISGIIWIQGNVSYRYNTAQHQTWLLSFLVPFITLFALIIPFFMLLELYWKRKSLDDFVIRQKWGYLYNEYTSQSYFWEVVKIYQKSLIIIFMTFYEDVIVVKAAIIFIIVFIYQQLSKSTKPFSNSFLNEYDEQSSIICGLSIVMGITIYAANLTDNQEVIWPFYVILIFGNGIFIFRLLLELIKAQIEQNQEALDKLRDKINERLPQLKHFSFLQKHFLQNRRQQRTRIEMKFKLVKGFLKKIARDRMTIKKIQEQSLIQQVINNNELKAECNSNLSQRTFPLKTDQNQVQIADEGKEESLGISNTLEMQYEKQPQYETLRSFKDNPQIKFKFNQIQSQLSRDYSSISSAREGQIGMIQDKVKVTPSSGQNGDEGNEIQSLVQQIKHQPSPLEDNNQPVEIQRNLVNYEIQSPIQDN